MPAGAHQATRKEHNQATTQYRPARVAGREGFEPSEELLTPLTRLAGGRFQPLSHLPMSGQYTRIPPCFRSAVCAG